MGFLASLAPISGIAQAAATLLAPRQKVAVPQPTDMSFKEMLEAQETKNQKLAERRADESLRLNDFDRDGLLTRAETGLDEKAFGRMDTNHDGFVNRNELVQAYLKPQG